MQTILAAIDFSEASQNALNYAAYLANAFNSRLIVVHAYTGTEGIDNEPVFDLLELPMSLEDANLKYLETQMQGLIRKYTVRISGYVKKGKPVSVIKKISKTEKPSLIVMGMKGRGKSSSFFGSTTVAMIGKTDIPMIVIPEKAIYQPIETLVVAIDLQDKRPVSRFRVLNQLIERYKPVLRILNIQKKGGKLTANLISGKMRSGLIWSKYEHEFYMIESEDVQKGIHDFLRRHPANMIAMMAGKHNLLEKIFSRSQTRTMTRQTKIPLLVMHPPGLKRIVNP